MRSWSRLNPNKRDPTASAAPVFRNPQVNLYVEDVQRSVAFYRDLFGFQETFRTPETGRPDHAEVRLGSLVLGLASAESLRRVHGVVAGAGPPQADLVLWTEDVDQAYAFLQTKGVRPLSPPHDFSEALRAAWVADPDGHALRIVMRRTPH